MIIKMALILYKVVFELRFGHNKEFYKAYGALLNQRIVIRWHQLRYAKQGRFFHNSAFVYTRACRVISPQWVKLNQNKVQEQIPDTFHVSPALKTEFCATIGHPTSLTDSIQM